jgi:hypothetical protein
MSGDVICWLDEYFQSPFVVYSRQNLFALKRLINLKQIKATFMKKVIAFVALVAFLSACSQYTCPTYSKKEVKKAAGQHRI